MAAHLLRPDVVANAPDEPSFEETVNHRQRELLHEILAYCVEHPDAKDTVDGILNWWRRGGVAEAPVAERRSAIDLLISMGWLTRPRASSFGEIYGVNKAKLPEIRQYLKSEVKQQ